MILVEEVKEGKQIVITVSLSSTHYHYHHAQQCLCQMPTSSKTGISLHLTLQTLFFPPET
jgi:hypothetical protein